MKITGLKHSLKGKGSYIALAICMIGIGACGWLTIGKNVDDHTAKVDKKLLLDCRLAEKNNRKRVNLMV